MTESEIIELAKKVSLNFANRSYEEDLISFATEIRNRTLDSENKKLDLAVGLLVTLLEWDHLDGSADGPFWRKQIEMVLESIKGDEK